ncbi:MAG TPA: hypothetical protein VNN79_03380 [Actinomycetota bacterium]|nr:hypothetical protein [Actinomycetota bacterium]
MTDEQTKPDPLARQSDLVILRQEQKTQHVITRAMIVVFAVPNVARTLPYVLGSLGVGTSWLPRWLHW